MEDDMYIDTHSHIYENEFLEDRAEVVERAREAGVGKIVLPDIDSESRGRMLDTAAAYPGMMFPLAGLHPTSVREDYREELAAVERELGARKYYGIGECGLDFYWDRTYWREQVKALEWQLGMAREAHLPVVIHSRDSLAEVFESLERYSGVQGILHCFPGGAEEARRAVGMGFLLGIGGVVTFKRSQMAETVREIGAEPLVLETDAPYLAPVPKRGKRNESSYIPIIAEKVAEIIGMEAKKIEEITTKNAMNLFNLHSENV